MTKSSTQLQFLDFTIVLNQFYTLEKSFKSVCFSQKSLFHWTKMSYWFLQRVKLVTVCTVTQTPLQKISWLPPACVFFLQSSCTCVSARWAGIPCVLAGPDGVCDYIQVLFVDPRWKQLGFISSSVGRTSPHGQKHSGYREFRCGTRWVSYAKLQHLTEE